MDDLSTLDRLHVRSLATTFILDTLSQLGLTFKERKKDGARKNSSLWGMTLEALLRRDQNHHPYAKIPIIYDEILNLLETSGIEVIPIFEKVRPLV